MSLLFSVHAPEKSQISTLLHPSLEDLLLICRKHQEKKCESTKLTRSTSDCKQQQQEKEEAKAPKGDTGGEPLNKRRRTLEGDGHKDSNSESVLAETAGTSKDEAVKAEKKEKAQEGSQRQAQKNCSIWGTKPQVDWIDSLAKAIQSTINKVPA